MHATILKRTTTTKNGTKKGNVSNKFTIQEPPSKKEIQTLYRPHNVDRLHVVMNMINMKQGNERIYMYESVTMPSCS